jgi:hypothetical protein
MPVKSELNRGAAVLRRAVQFGYRALSVIFPSARFEKEVARMRVPFTPSVAMGRGFLSAHAIQGTWFRRLGFAGAFLALALTVVPMTPAKASLWDCFNALVPIGPAEDVVAAAGEASTCVGDAETDPIMIAAIALFMFLALDGDLGKPVPPTPDTIISTLNGDAGQLLVKGLTAAGFGGLADTLVGALKDHLSLTDIPILGLYISCGSKVAGLPGVLYAAGETEAANVSGCADTLSCVFGCDPPPAPPQNCSQWLSFGTTPVDTVQAPGPNFGQPYTTTFQQVDACGESAGAAIGWQKLCSTGSDAVHYVCQSCDAIRGAVTGNHINPNAVSGSQNQTGGPQCVCQNGMVDKRNPDDGSLLGCICPFGAKVVETDNLTVSCKQDCGIGNCVMGNGAGLGGACMPVPIQCADGSYAKLDANSFSGTALCYDLCPSPPVSPPDPSYYANNCQQWEQGSVGSGGACHSVCGDAQWVPSGDYAATGKYSCIPCQADQAYIEAFNFCYPLTTQTVYVPGVSYGSLVTVYVPGSSGSATPANSAVLVEPRTATGTGQTVTSRPLAISMLPGSGAMEVVCPPYAVPNASGTACVLRFDPRSSGAPRRTERSGASDGSARTFIVKLGNEKPGEVILKPDGLPSGVTLKPKADPGTVILKPKGEPTTVILKPEANPTAVILKPNQGYVTDLDQPKGEPTTTILKPEGNPTTVILKPNQGSVTDLDQRRGDPTTVILVPKKPAVTTTILVPRQDTSTSKPTPKIIVPEKDLTPKKYTTTIMAPRQNAPTATVMVPRQPTAVVVTPTAPKIQMMPMPSPTAPRPKP